MESIFSIENLLALITLTVMEIVLGVDNIIFISILAGKLPVAQQRPARQIGLALALITRLLLLLSISWIASLTQPLFEIGPWHVTGRSLIMLGGGLFLIYKATTEIHEKLEGAEHGEQTVAATTMQAVVFQIILLDIVFSLDSVITAVGMANELWVMMVAVIIAVGVMLFLAEGIARFVNEHPTVKMLALSFLLLIGFSLVAEGFELHIPKGYIYFAMGFSVMVELLNLRVAAKTKARHPVQLHQRYDTTKLSQ
ncbi:TerC family protein [Chloroflexus sp.]|uniref:TerC family protein n=1 Tax=Chloroflexus sp. TaxID=1904827 RepID=UPI002619A804|nr:TerC family protein [uncultured Chloroflexus sp.]